MIVIDAKQVMELRNLTGAGVVDAKNALEEAGGDMDKAIEILKKKGAAKAAKKSGERTTSEGIVAAYIHHTKKLGSLIELQCETDFVARNEEFQTLAQDIAMQVAAIDPLYISVVDIPVNELDKQREIFMAEMAEENKPEEIKNKIIEGKLNKWYSEVCLMNQAFFKDEDKTIAELLEEKIAKIGEKIVVKRMTRYHIS
ncbi:elongation factor Ts [Patescibacteria group bacterium]|nr:elongation factor Ts [Patescibacteria group bacterium]MBU1034557.1 elongation factor Ts [Patescibacteria group bacterium]MBU1629790.1 elongation factor Ts [Patescibacteria group bacterium]MBU1908377.1 elongation factor Ts [Patescibacteria group bacterium]